jgi:DNA topoisomerase-1
MKAPQADPNGRRALVKFSRIEKQHYVASELEKGKASGWRADYDESSQTWVERVAEAKSATGKRRKKTA